MKLLTSALTILLLSPAAFAATNISISINGETFQCAGQPCEYYCEGQYVGKCEGREVDTRKDGRYVLIRKNADGSFGHCLRYIAEATDFDGLVTCRNLQKQVCD